MGASTLLPAEQVAVEPGQTETCEVQVRNTGQVVDRFVLDVVGDATSWVTVEPSTLNLFPGETKTATVTFAPPRSPDVLAGEVGYAIRVMSSEDVEGSSVEEGTIEVLEYTEVAAELLPRTSRGSRRGKQQVAVDNKGNRDVAVTVRVFDPDDQLVGGTKTPTVVTAPGTATLVKLRVKPRKSFLRGPTKTLPYQVEVVPERGEQVVVDSAMVQDQILPKWLPAAMALAAAAVVALVVLWFSVFKPVVSSTARQVAQQENASLSSQVSEAKQEAAEAKQQVEAVTNPDGNAQGTQPGAGSGQDGSSDGDAQAGSDGDAATDGNGDANGNSSSSPSTSGSNAPNASSSSGGSSARDFRIQVDSAPGAVGTYTTNSYTSPDGKTLLITDLILENPSGDKGLLQIRRGTTVLFSFGLENFRDLDYHFVKPIEFKAGSPVVVAVSCQNTGTRCSPAAYFSGSAG